MKKLTNEDAVEKLENIYKNEYELLSTIEERPVKIRHKLCKTEFEVKKINTILNQKELCPCPTCSSKKNPHITIDAARAKLLELYGNKFFLLKFKDLKSPCILKCLDCGSVFKLKNAYFLKEKDENFVCPKCKKSEPIEDELKNILNNAVDGKYYKWQEEFKGLNQKHLIKHICGTEYETKPNIFKNGKGRCPLCNKNRIKIRRDVIKTLKKIDSKKTEIISLYKGVKPYIADIFIPSKHIAIDIIDPYWNSEVFEGEMYKKLKVEKFEAEGITLIQIWRTDWENNRLEIVTSLKELIFPEYVQIAGCVLLDPSTLKTFFIKNSLNKTLSQLNFGVFSSNNQILYICGLSDSGNGTWIIDYYFHISNFSAENALDTILSTLSNKYPVKSVKCISEVGNKFLLLSLKAAKFTASSILPPSSHYTDFLVISNFKENYTEKIWDSGYIVYSKHFKNNFKNI